MIKGIFQSARGMQSANKNMEIIANNLANLNTIGFKREGTFSEILSSVSEPKIKSSVDLYQGEVFKTSNPLDLAISGEGEFVLKTENGYEYSRNGKFKISDDGFLVNETGHKVMGKKGEINLSDYILEDQNSILITRQGEIKLGESSIDEIMIVKISPEEYDKRKLGLNFNPTESVETILDSNEYQILQGYLEESNVNPIQEMENMITISKDYETSYKMVTYLDHSLEKSNEIGRV
ncbi:MAG: flagellar hook basal-body protein [Ignavibacteriaceae bacterium]|nr:flagellar hook basal-body protein [Ignavibacteriaceae bacterium]